MPIITCDICDKHNVPGSHGQDSTGCDVTQCYVCEGDEFDPYGETEEAAEDERAYQEYLDSQNSPALNAMERAGDRGPLRYSAEAYDEMVRQDAEGRS